MQTASLFQKMSTSGCHPLKMMTNLNIPWKRKEELLPERLFLTSSRHSGKAFSIRISLLCFGSSGMESLATWLPGSVKVSPLPPAGPRSLIYRGQQPGSQAAVGSRDVSRGPVPDTVTCNTHILEQTTGLVTCHSFQIGKKSPNSEYLHGRLSNSGYNLIWLQQVRSTVVYKHPPMFVDVSGLMLLCSLLSLLVNTR